MPHIRARGIDQKTLEGIAEEIVVQIAKVTQTPHDHFTVEHIQSAYIAKGGASGVYPFIEVLWFDRGQETKTKVASIIDSALRPVVGEKTDITIVFSDLRGQDYYENREHF